MSDSDDDSDRAMRLAFLMAMLGAGDLNDLRGASARPRRAKHNTRLCEYVMVAAIDFGTTFSGYAFSFKDQLKDVHMNKNWGAEAGCTSFKTPTCVLVDPQKKFHAFGYDAQQKYAEEEDPTFYFFDKFKMKLFEGKGLNKSAVLKAANGKTLPALDIFAMALNYMKQHLLDSVNGSLKRDVDEKMIRWVITVPAIWTDASKQFMREAALKGELIDNTDSGQLMIALEPEAASLYVRKMDIDRVIQQSETETLTIKPGTKYLVVDAGGGTLDITAHELLPDGRVKELHFATGGAYGGIKVDEQFEKLSQKIFGADFINEYKVSSASQWLQLTNDFEKRKRISGGSINMPLPYTFISKVQEQKKLPIQDVIKAYPGEGISFPNGILRCEPEIVATLFTPVINGIVRHIQELLKNKKLKDIEYFFCVGGFNESKYLQSALQENFAKNYKLLIPEEASLAVVKGAIQFGHQPDVISSRVSARSYGVSAMTDFIPILHDFEKMVMVNGRLMCMDTFTTFVRKDQEVPVGFTQTHEFKPVTEEVEEAKVKVFSSDRDRAQYVTDEGVEHHADITVKWNGTGRDRTIKITMTFGGTEVEVEAVTFPGENHAETKINFLSE